jgi:hypothetical protein
MELDTYAQVKYQIKAILNIDLDYYKDQQMRRRLDSWLVRSGAPSWENYFHRIRGDMVESGRLKIQYCPGCSKRRPVYALMAGCASGVQDAPSVQSLIVWQ